MNSPAGRSGQSGVSRTEACRWELDFDELLFQRSAEGPPAKTAVGEGDGDRPLRTLTSQRCAGRLHTHSRLVSNPEASGQSVKWVCGGSRAVGSHMPHPKETAPAGPVSPDCSREAKRSRDPPQFFKMGN